MHAVWSLLITRAFAYGEVVDDRPSWANRELHVYTNLARVDPTYWEDDYGCSMGSWTSSEQQPKDPLYYHDGLTEIAQLHSQDMASHGFMSHTSSDGTDFASRVAPYYGGYTMGENVAYGYSNNFSAMFDGWMCSSGHRANIMSTAYQDLGAGVQGAYYTQDFGGGAGSAARRVAMGVHIPQSPSSSVTFVATWHDNDAPTWLAVETDDDCIDMSRFAGSQSMGAWQVDASPGDGCVAYRFAWERSNGDLETLPDTGAWQYGSGCDAWVADEPSGCREDEPDDSGSDDTGGGGGDGGGDGGGAQDCPDTDRNGDCLPDDDRASNDDDIRVTGCNAIGAAGGAWLLMVLPLAMRRR